MKQIDHQEIYNLLKCTDDNKRLEWLKTKLNDLEIPYVVDTFYSNKYLRFFNNIISTGDSDKWVIAHFDTVRPEFCANDNTASVINLIRLKALFPSLNVALLDGEEPPYLGIGSNRLSTQIVNNVYQAKWILNLELTGVGYNICLGQRQQGILKDLFSNFRSGFEEIFVPFSDSDILDKYKIPNVVLFTLPSNPDGSSDHKFIWYCHSSKDHPGIITPETMLYLTDDYLKEFFEQNI